MSFLNERLESPLSPETSPKIEIKTGYEDFVPTEFKEDPFDYFSQNGQNLKPWTDKIKVKEFIWTNQQKQQLAVVAKIISWKEEIKNSNDPFYEYNLMEIIRNLHLPTANPLIKVEQNDKYLIVTERIPGINFAEIEQLVPQLKAQGYNETDIEDLKKQILIYIENLKEKFEAAGIYKDPWKLKDMIFDIDIKNKKIKQVIPTDWERTKVDQTKLNEYIKLNQ